MGIPPTEVELIRDMRLEDEDGRGVFCRVYWRGVPVGSVQKFRKRPPSKSPESIRKLFRELRACLKIAWHPAARDFGCGPGGEVGASPQRAVTTEPTQATGKRPAARRVFDGKAGWLRCSSVGDRCGYPPSSRLAFQPSVRKQDVRGIFRQALKGKWNDPWGGDDFCETKEEIAIKVIRRYLKFNDDHDLVKAMLADDRRAIALQLKRVAEKVQRAFGDEEHTH